ncbi:ATP-binding protein [Methanohalophilus mahii]|uniref:PP-loop domain protein n=1 Tax=Methanohalophilus mahii (strain ATCC 35705 / DSM 5219 / SLP) TaxID=547558 RepID=D5EBA8_METMS|nr:tRNA 2-thiocytidine biosynthesis TtcA family protein [Methanohalophilus mahii]ADE36459.1 PP-loop domain protein [Methanohalophilus mahii DSM 5219]
MVAETPLLCKICGANAVSGRGNFLCEIHFCEMVEKKVRAHIEDQNLILNNEHIAVALSGGKDSSVLLYILAKILPEFEGVKLTAITVDEGIPNYREETLTYAQELATFLNIEHRIVSFRENFGAPLPDLLKKRNVSACTLCGVLRRKILEQETFSMDVPKLATGHSLDDEAETAMMNILTANIDAIINTASPNSGKESLRIKPLSVLNEHEIALYGILKGIFHEFPECPYAGPSLRAEVRQIFLDLETKYPKITG